jgi:riboflavin synthase
MFTGLIEELGTVVDLSTSGTSECLKIKAFDVFEGSGSNPGEGSQNLQNGLKIGDSIAVNGVCLTATTVVPPYFEVTCVAETLAKTTLGSLTTGMRVNLERACTPVTRLGGHLVAGHVDGTAKVAEIRELDGSHEFFFELPTGAERYVIPMGSIAINGISLTVAEITHEVAKGRGAVIKIAIIPHTYSHTNVQSLKTGDEVNIELDQIAKMVEKLVSPMRTA